MGIIPSVILRIGSLLICISYETQKRILPENKMHV